eukprot:TRINITY_DN40700_c0_g1_i1.p1 TRINITY_DN40700_c0_g1~~TRINITY_DN40700_c0_g1_i1.p1  ORF type:complete len:339 (-),score=74.66 TRINITY_DN40700_c0_g1_i1:53-1048(-)
MATRALIVFPGPRGVPCVPAVLQPRLGDKFAIFPVNKAAEAFPALETHKEFIVVNQGGTKADLSELLSHAKGAAAKCLWIHSLTAGVDPLMSQEVRDAACPTTNAKGVFSWALAEYVMAAILHFEKQIPRLQKNRQAHNYERFHMTLLRGKQLGIVGYGDIGSQCAQFASALGMKVVGLKRRAQGTSHDGLATVVGPDHWEAIFRESDYVLAVLPGTPDNANKIGAAEFAAMKPTGVFINIGRGNTVHEPSLAEVLREHKIKGAALDVFAKEPLQADHPFWDLENLLLSPHNADLTDTSITETFEHFVDLAEKYFLQEKPFPSLVDLQLGY